VISGVAIVGCGSIGSKRAAALPDGVRVVSVFDVVETRARDLAEGLDSDVLAASRLEDAVAAEGVDLVIVATVHDQLPVGALAALDAGRHVLVEKPGAHRLDALCEVAARAASVGRTVRVGFNHRFHPAIRHAHDLATSGRYGRVMSIRARYGHGGRLGYEREWRMDPAISGGGELIDQGMHLIDLTRCFLGDVDLEYAALRTEFWPVPVEDNAYVALRGRSGGFAWLHASWTEWKNLFNFEIALEHAKVEIRGLGGSYGPERLLLYEMQPEMGPPPVTSWEWPGPDRSWADELVDVIGGLAGAPTIGAALDDCIAAFNIVDEANRR